MNILLAVDGSPYTQRMIGYVAENDEWLGSKHRYTVVHATPPLRGVGASGVDPRELRAIYRNEAEKVFKPIRAFFEQRGIAANFVNLVGPVAESIAKRAERDSCDLLVMGSHGHGYLVNLVMGSVATKVLAGCKVPVLLIR